MCPRPSKNTRSPAWRSSRETGTPTELYCIAALCGNEIPTCAYTYIAKPEQSKPPGLAPPHTYGVPRYCIAIATAWPPSVPDGGIGMSPPVDDDEDDELVPPPVAAAAAALAAASWRRCSSSISRLMSLE